MTDTQQQLIIHAGDGKTGSSALQSSLALSQERLLELGIAYPHHDSFVDARAGRISSGNVEPETLVENYRAARAETPEIDTYLYSNEHFFQQLVQVPTLLDPLLAEGVRIRIVLFIRNPFDQALSGYVQTVKRHGSTLSLEEFLPRFNRPAKVLNFLDLAGRLGIEATVLNYSQHSKDLKTAFAGAIGIDPSDLADSPQPNVNRGLTRSEMQLQRAFNAAWGAGSSAFISDPLCNELPDIDSEIPLLSRAAYDGFVDRLTEVTGDVNDRLPPSEHYRFAGYAEIYGDPPPPETTSLAFSGDQLDVLARAVSARIAPLPDPEEAAETLPEDPAPAPPEEPPAPAPRGFFRRLLSRA